MSSQPHRNNSDFQLRYFIAGGCHTPDGAWNILYEQMLDIQIKLEHTKAAILRRQAKILDIQEVLDDPKAKPSDKMRAQADMIEWKSGEGLTELSLAGAEKEVVTIKALMAELEPHRKYGNLPLLEATEAAQHDEWSGEFKHRIENYLITQGFIPEDQLRAMRSCPSFDNDLLPHIRHVQHAMAQQGDRLDLLKTGALIAIEQKQEDTSTDSSIT
tara:strand:+ start:68 stop:712 length:645 start_codon:yes stop_codon:yes gene_type:complete